MLYKNVTLLQPFLAVQLRNNQKKRKEESKAKNVEVLILVRFYRAMHFSAKRGIAIACRLSVCLSVCLSVRL